MALTLITPPAAEPIGVDKAKEHANIAADFIADDALLEGFITTARQRGELLTNAAWILSTWEERLSAFPKGVIRLPLHPVQEVISVSYIDGDGQSQALSSDEYQVRIFGQLSQCELHPAYGRSWPTARAVPDALTIRFTAGWPVDDVPEALLTWLKTMVSTMYEHREDIQAGYGQGLQKLPGRFFDGLLDRYMLREMA